MLRNHPWSIPIKIQALIRNTSQYRSLSTAKQVDNALGSVCLSVRLFACLFAECNKERRRVITKSKMFVCVSVISGCMPIIAQMRSIGQLETMWRIKTPSINAQCRSMTINDDQYQSKSRHWSEISLNIDQCCLMLDPWQGCPQDSIEPWRHLKLKSVNWISLILHWSTLRLKREVHDHFGPNFASLFLTWPYWDMNLYLIGITFTVNQLNLTAVKFSFLKTKTYLTQENLTFGKTLFFQII